MPSQEKIRVLIVDDNADTRENIRRILQFDLSIEVVGEASSGTEALEQAYHTKADVIIIDINMPGMDGITATEIIRKKVPHSQVIFLSVQNDPMYMRRAMRAGASDYLIKPPSIDDLTAAIHRAGETAALEKNRSTAPYVMTGGLGGAAGIMSMQTPGKIVLVYSPKGGTGCTTIATNLSVALKEISDTKKVILIDADLQYGDVPVFFNEQVRKTILDLSSRVDDLDAEVVEEVVKTHTATGIGILPSPPKIEIAEKIDPEQFGKLLKYLTNLYAYVVVDTSSYLSDVVSAAIDNASIILLVTTQEIPSIKNLNVFLTLADASSIAKDRIVLVVNKYDRRLAITAERIAESLRQPVIGMIPYEEKAINSSINRGVPLIVENKNHPISKSIQSLADNVKNQLIKLDSTEIPVRS
ncbi:MAG: response regulator [Anaerolineae bacterium]|jgi:pilus assembly protein CpaE|nr:response regulator [Anaerolineae bacterium]